MSVEESPPAEPSSAKPRSVWQRARFVFKVIEVRVRFIAILVGTGLVIGYWDTLVNHYERWVREPRPAVVAVAKDTEFYCPMHPHVVRDGLEPNGEVPKCPICGMPLSLRRKGAPSALPEGVTARVQLSPERIRLAGVRTETVTFRPLAKEVVTVGTVLYDETRLSRIVTRVSGYFEKLYVKETFVPVRAGDPLAEIYSPELYVSMQELIVAAADPVGQDRQKGRARERLRLLGVAEAEIDEALRTGIATPRVTIRSPQSGHVIERAVLEGAHVEAGATLFEVADLTSVWIEADVFEKDLPFLEVGQAIEAMLEAYPDRTFRGTVSLVHPHVDARTRTNPVRFSLANKDHELRPGMFATVRIHTPIDRIEPFRGLAQAIAAGPLFWCPMHPEVVSSDPQARCEKCGGMQLVPKPVPQAVVRAGGGAVLAVPERAVIDTGTKKVVYIEREDGLFEGVLVRLGPRIGDHYPVIEGLKDGDRVAAAGAFLIDAETRLNPAAASAYVGAGGGPHKGHREEAPHD